MNNIVLIVLSLSISGSFIALLLFVGKPIFKKHVSKAFSYYIWMLVLLRLVIPFSFDQSVMNQLLNGVSSNPHIKNELTVNNEIVKDESEQLMHSKEAYEIVSSDKSQQSIIENDQVNATGKNNETISVQTIIVILWLTGACIAFLFCVIPYIQFKLRIKDTNTEPVQEDIKILHKLYNGKRIRLKYNSYVSTPMLIGIISPYIVIPGCNYVKSGKTQELENIVCHELMHYRRKDLIYKWFTVIVTSLHWFNPLMLSIRRQISRSCELSCDEAVIKNMNAIQKQSYGETLLSMAAGKRLSTGILSTTLCEEKEELKERLVSIMKYKKLTAGMLFLSIIIVVLLTGSATILGSVSKAETSRSSAQGDNSDNEIGAIKSTDELKWYGETSLISEETVLPDTIINSEDAMNDFLNSDRTIALLAAMPKEDIYIYGLKENGSGGEDDYLYYCHGICIRQGNDIQVLDIDWGVYGDIPQIQYKDYDNDGQKELAMILRSASGTDLSLIDLHIFEKTDDGGWSDQYFSDWANQMNKLVTYEINNGILRLFVKDEVIEEINMSAFEEGWGGKFKTITFGNNVKFLFNDGKIYLQALPKAIVGNWVTPQEITDKYIQMEVQYHSGFELSEASTVSESAGIITDSGLNTKNNETEKVEGVISDNYNSVFDGNIGEQSISMAIYRDGDQLTASYITQNDEDSEIHLQGAIDINTASFTLYSEGNSIIFKGTLKPDTSEGELLEGTYTSSKNEEENAFTLALSHGIGNTYETRYPLTESNTEDVETFARKIKSYVKDNNKKSLAELIAYPISVSINGAKVSISKEEEFEQNYDDIMNAELKGRISKSYTKYMFSNYMGIMLGNGEVWFENWEGKGLRMIAINN
jgi:beta-lactamase regulating signal transducer with metallopeptidase domain